MGRVFRIYQRLDTRRTVWGVVLVSASLSIPIPVLPVRPERALYNSEIGCTGGDREILA